MFPINTIITQITHKTFKLISNNSLFWNSTHISKVGISFYSKIKILTKVLKYNQKYNHKYNHINYRWYFVYFVMSAFFKLLFFLNKYPNLLCFFLNMHNKLNKFFFCLLSIIDLNRKQNAKPGKTITVTITPGVVGWVETDPCFCQ